MRVPPEQNFGFLNSLCELSGFVRTPSVINAMDLPIAVRATYVALMSYSSASENHRGIFPSLETLSVKLGGVARSTISAAIAHLEEVGFIEVERTKNKRNSYYLTNVPLELGKQWVEGGRRGLISVPKKNFVCSANGQICSANGHQCSANGQRCPIVSHEYRYNQLDLNRTRSIQDPREGAAPPCPPSQTGKSNCRGKGISGDGEGNGDLSRMTQSGKIILFPGTNRGTVSEVVSEGRVDGSTVLSAMPEIATCPAQPCDLTHEIRGEPMLDTENAPEGNSDGGESDDVPMTGFPKAFTVRGRRKEKADKKPFNQRKSKTEDTAKQLITFWQSTLRANGYKADEDFSRFALKKEISAMTKALGVDMSRRVCEFAVENWEALVKVWPKFRTEPNLYNLTAYWVYPRVKDFVLSGGVPDESNHVDGGETCQNGKSEKEKSTTPTRTIRQWTPTGMR